MGERKKKKKSLLAAQRTWICIAPSEKGRCGTSNDMVERQVLPPGGVVQDA